MVVAAFALDDSAFNSCRWFLIRFSIVLATIKNRDWFVMHNSKRELPSQGLGQIRTSLP